MQNRDTFIENRLTARVGVRGLEGWSENAKGLRDMDNSVVIVEMGGWVEVEEGIRRINGNGKNTIKYVWKLQKII